MNYFSAIDTRTFLIINHWQNKILNFLSVSISWITEGGFLWFLICFFIILFDKRQKRRKTFLLILALLLADWIVNVFFKLLVFCRERPYMVFPETKVMGKIWSNCSFPSGHLASSCAALFVLGYIYNLLRKKWFLIFSSIFIFLLGFSRIYVGMHYLSDVLGGILIGIISGFSVTYFDKQVKWLK
jgi:undecaprenyl-diphosphatase